MKENTWSENHIYFDTFYQRIEYMFSFVDFSYVNSLIDLGCGKSWAKKLLPDNIKYIPCDLYKRSEETIQCDFNNGKFPNIKADIALLSGIIEYIYDIDTFIKNISNNSKYVICSYHFAEITEQRSKIWVNNYTIYELLKVFKKYNYELEMPIIHTENHSGESYLFFKKKNEKSICKYNNKNGLNITTLYVKDFSLLGDKVISKTFNYLLDNIQKTLSTEACNTTHNLLPASKHYQILKKYKIKLRKIKDLIFYKFVIDTKNENFYSSLLNNLEFLLTFLKWRDIVRTNKELQEYYKQILQNSNTVIFSGGGIFQHSYMEIWRGIYPVIKYCSKHNIPVYFNAIGIEKTNNCIENMLYKYLINKKCVKAITTRDDYNYLQQIVNKDKKIAHILDSGMWTKEAYNISKNINSNIIGIGIIRPKIFSDNGVCFTAKQVEQMYTNVISEIDSRGYNWQLFCNGGQTDYNFGIDLLNKLNKPLSHIAQKPNNAEELVKIISNYKAIIATRLHANIIATSLGIPTVGIAWNKKLIRFSEQIQTNCNFIDEKDFSNTEYIIKQLEETLKNGLPIQRIIDLKKETYTTMESIIKILIEEIK